MIITLLITVVLNVKPVSLIMEVEIMCCMVIGFDRVKTMVQCYLCGQWYPLHKVVEVPKTETGYECKICYEWEEENC